MRVLGVHGTSQELYLAVADGGLIVAGMPERFTIPNGLALSPDLVSLRDEVRRRLREMSIVLRGGPRRGVAAAGGAYELGPADSGGDDRSHGRG